MLKVTVTGFINEVFAGNDEQVEQFLLDVKKRQEQTIEQADMKEYRRIMPPFQHSMLNDGSSKKFNRPATRYTDYVDLYKNPSQFLKEFRETNKPFGLKIKIERVQDPSTNFF